MWDREGAGGAGVTQPKSLLTLSDLKMLGIDMVSCRHVSQIPVLMPRF